MSMASFEMKMNEVYFAVIVILIDHVAIGNTITLHFSRFIVSIKFIKKKIQLL